jgi:hypothetical protein
MNNLNHRNSSTSPNVKHLIASSVYDWEHSSDFDDQDTEKWYTHGITTSADAFEKGEFRRSELREGMGLWTLMKQLGSYRQMFAIDPNKF